MISAVAATSAPVRAGRSLLISTLQLELAELAEHLFERRHRLAADAQCRSLARR